MRYEIVATKDGMPTLKQPAKDRLQAIRFRAALVCNGYLAMLTPVVAS